MKTLFVILVCALLSSPVYAFDDWSKTDVGLQIAYTALHIIDWGQTRWMNENPSKQVVFYTYNKNTNSVDCGNARVYYFEQNPLLGKYPSKTKIDLFFAATLIAHTAISYVLPSNYRKLWIGATIGLEAYTVNGNFNAGVKGFF